MNVVTESDEFGTCGYVNGRLSCYKNTKSGPQIVNYSDIPLYIAAEIRDDRDSTYFRFMGKGFVDGRDVRFTMKASDAVNAEKFRSRIVQEGGARNSVGKITLDLVQKATAKTEIIQKVTRPVFKDGKFTVPGLHEHDSSIYELSKLLSFGGT